MMKRLAHTLAALAATLAVAAPAAAAQWPENPLQMIVQFPPGSTTDAVARDIAMRLEKQIGQSVVVVNKPGAGGIVGVSNIARAKPDGYTLGTVNYPTLAIIPHQQAVPYDPLKDFSHLAVVGPYDYGIFVRADAPWKTFKELVDYGKANPGKLSFGTLGAGTTNELVMNRLGRDLGMQWQFIPYKGDNESVTALIGGQIDVVNASANATLPQVRAGKLRMLVSSGPGRWSALPDVPALRETGLVDYAQESYFSLAAPAGIPAVAQEKLAQALKTVLTDPEVIESFQQKYGQAVRYEDGASYAKTVARDYQRWSAGSPANVAKH
ncbi:tripartite tricarboxylate transporter substrate binding protein [Bordetella bronchiseptica]|uniref:tripartite tricarboxylate transporter substrate binding protein n=1 Tax=Bordetella bronchiseptica TaxID=518 RepID=UPI00045BA21F|nr:tripartite tricarboxylate transporter substrate binding protein [Bordetella bronchiseptica]KCV52047.1 tripartite tricarboxylate transporter family receptor [Bordetella bronchiseptica 7E71]